MRIYLRESRLTLCQRFLIAFKLFWTVPDFPVPARAVSQAIQADFLGLLSPQLPASFCLTRVLMSIASSLDDQVVEVFPLLSLSSAIVTHARDNTDRGYGVKGQVESSKMKGQVASVSEMK
jgi:hypothetical protein